MPDMLISLSSFGAAEVRRHGQLWFTRLAAQDGAVLAAAAVDPSRWELVHFSLWAHDTPKADGEVFQVLHLSAPGLAGLERGRQW